MKTMIDLFAKTVSKGLSNTTWNRLTNSLRKGKFSKTIGVTAQSFEVLLNTMPGALLQRNILVQLQAEHLRRPPSGSLQFQPKTNTVTSSLN